MYLCTIACSSIGDIGLIHPGYRAKIEYLDKDDEEVVVVLADNKRINLDIFKFCFEELPI